MRNIMLDLETLGLKHDAAILSIGAVAFSKCGISDEFYCVVNMSSCIAVGLSIDSETIEWWMKQSDEARSVFNDERAVALPMALNAFSEWIGRIGNGKEDVRMWGNGASFDNVILSNAYAACGMKKPWSFRNDMCYRTLKNMHPYVESGDRTGVYHNALDDARYQARHCIKLISRASVGDGLQRRW